MGPGGLPIVTDLIQGVFFASHAAVLTEKLGDLGAPFSGTTSTCWTVLGVASSSLFFYATGAAVLGVVGVVTVLTITVLRPRPVVHAVVGCCVFVADCCKDAVRTVGKIRAAGNAARFHRNRPPQAVLAPSGVGWMLSGFTAAGMPVELTVSDAELHSAADGLVVGSEPSESDIVLNDPSISSRHARIVLLEESIGIVDPGSASGTSVNEDRIASHNDPTPMRPGSQVKLGEVTLKLVRVG